MWVKVLTESSDLINRALQFLSGSPTDPEPPSAEYIDTGYCGHYLDCVLAKYGDYAAVDGTLCDVGAGAVIGATNNTGWGFVPLPGGGYYLNWYYLRPLQPRVTSAIRFDGPDEN